MLTSANGNPSTPVRSMLLCVPPVPIQMGNRLCAGRGEICTSCSGERKRLPGDALGGVELHEQLKFFREQMVLVGKIVAKQRKRFGENASSGDDLGAAAGDKIDGRKVLEDQGPDPPCSGW